MIYDITQKIWRIQQEKVKSSTIVYHYTNQAGLYGILNSKSLWATNLLFMNDSQEISYAFNLTRQKLKALHVQLDTPDSEKEWVSHLLHFLDSFPGSHVTGGGAAPPKLNPKYKFTNSYVASFSTVEDDLSQWRAYGGKGDSYSIGFKVSTLRKLRPHFSGFENCMVGQCEYDRVVHNQWIDALVQQSLTRSHEKQYRFQDEDKKHYSFTNDLLVNVGIVSPLLKNPAFSAEKEVRYLASNVLDIYADLDIKVQRLGNPSFRPGKFSLIPYIELKLPEDDPVLGIDSIRIGPCQEPELAKHAVHQLLLSMNIDSYILPYESKGSYYREPSEFFPLLILHSEIPYRTH